MAESLIDENNKKSDVVGDSEFDALETLEEPITFTDEDGNEMSISSFEEALKLVIEGKVPSFVDDPLVTNLAEFGNTDGTTKVIEDDMNTCLKVQKKEYSDKKTNSRKKRQELSLSATRGLSMNHVPIEISFD